MSDNLGYATMGDFLDALVYLPAKRVKAFQTDTLYRGAASEGLHIFVAHLNGQEERMALTSKELKALYRLARKEKRHGVASQLLGYLRRNKLVPPKKRPAKYGRTAGPRRKLGGRDW